MNQSPLLQLLQAHKKIALDSVVFIYQFENKRYQPLTRIIFEHIERGDVVAVASTVTITEITVKLHQLEQPKKAQAYEAIVSHFPHLSIVDVTMAIASLAGQLGGTKNIKTPDAIHIATALTEKATLWVTNDRKHLRVQPEIDVLYLEDFV